MKKTLLSVQNDCSQLFVFPKKIVETLILNTPRVQSDRFTGAVNGHNIDIIARSSARKRQRRNRYGQNGPPSKFRKY